MLNEVDPAANRSTANGVTTVFAYTFRIDSKNEIAVLVELVEKTVDVDFTVDGIGNSGGGNITFLSAPANLAIVTRLRKQPAAQASVYTANEGFPHERVMADLDRLTMQIQQVREQLHRGFFLPKSSSLSDQGIDAPTVGAFARGKSGGGIDWATPTLAGSLSSPVAIADGGTGATSAAAARTALGIGALLEPIDTDFRVTDNGDITKKLAFQCSGISALTTRVWTPPDADLTFPLITAAGDIVVASASGVMSKIAVGAAGTILMSRAASSLKMAYAAALNKAIYGMTYANNAGDATNDIDLAAHGCMDATGAYWLQSGALTKRSDAGWAVGTNQGWLDTGAIGNNPYYVWTIGRSDTGVTDSLLSLSSTAPTMPSNYDFKRLVGYLLRAGGTIVAFHTYETEGGGLEFNWDAPTLDLDLPATLTTTRSTHALKVPLNFSTIAHINVELTDNAAAHYVWICCPDQTDAAPSNTAAPLANAMAGVDSLLAEASDLYVRTSAAGLIAARSSAATVDQFKVSTIGFTWARRN